MRVQVVPPSLVRYMPPFRATATMTWPSSLRSALIHIALAGSPACAVQLAPLSRDTKRSPGMLVATMTEPPGLVAVQCQVLADSPAGCDHTSAACPAVTPPPFVPPPGFTGWGATGVGTWATSMPPPPQPARATAAKDKTRSVVRSMSGPPMDVTLCEPVSARCNICCLMQIVQSSHRGLRDLVLIRKGAGLPGPTPA